MKHPTQLQLGMHLLIKAPAPSYIIFPKLSDSGQEFDFNSMRRVSCAGYLRHHREEPAKDTYFVEWTFPFLAAVPQLFIRCTRS